MVVRINQVLVRRRINLDSGVTWTCFARPFDVAMDGLSASDPVPDSFLRFSGHMFIERLTRIDIAFIFYDFREHFGLRYTQSMDVNDACTGVVIPMGVFAAIALIVHCSFILKYII